jgi:hypothetical protein
MGKLVIKDAGFELVTAVTMKSNDFRDVTPCNLVELYRRFGRTYSFQLLGSRLSQASSLKMEIFLRNIGQRLPDYTASHLREDSNYSSQPSKRSEIL